MIRYQFNEANMIELSKLTNELTRRVEPKLYSFYTEADATNDIDEKVYDELVEQITTILYKVGGLTVPLFNLRDAIEEEYTLQYRHSPELARKLWRDEYSALHKPYDKLKNKCFDHLDNLEEKYFKIKNKKPVIKNRITIDDDYYYNSNNKY